MTLFEEGCATPSDIWLHLPRLVALVVEQDATHVIELGVRDGNSTVAFLHGLEQTGGTLTSVDVAAAPTIGEHGNWEFIQGDDLAADVLGRMWSADIVFIDTTHEYDQTLRELDAYRPLVKSGGLIVLHDTQLVINGIRPVTQAIEEFIGVWGYEWTNNPTCNGLGEIRIS